jgi:hypothetical protein
MTLSLTSTNKSVRSADVYNTQYCTQEIEKKTIQRQTTYVAFCEMLVFSFIAVDFLALFRTIIVGSPNHLCKLDPGLDPPG